MANDFINRLSKHRMVKREVCDEVMVRFFKLVFIIFLTILNHNIILVIITILCTIN